MPDPGRHNPANQEQTSGAPEEIDPRLARRLFIAFLVIGALSIASAIVLPRANLDIPWYVFAIAFIAIVAAALAPLFEESEEPEPPTDDVAGRIGPRKPGD